MNEAKKRLIEVNLPLKEVSKDSVREKNTRQGHISTLHIWWARRPLAASRATALAALLPDSPDRREEYLQLIRDISPWDAVSKDTPQNNLLLERARRLILDANGGEPPKVLDCFAGGGAIPLESLRLGCETYALDYNPVAVLLNKAVLEYPQKFGNLENVRDKASGDLGMEGHRTVNRLLEEVEHWSNWVLDEAGKELGTYYPTDDDGSVPIGYIWARTLPCQNAECGAEIPLLRQMWLSKIDRTTKVDGKSKKVPFKRTALELFHENRQVYFRIRDVSLDWKCQGKKCACEHCTGTVSRAHVRCPVCGSTISDDDTRQLFQHGKSGQRMIAVVLRHPKRGKIYRLANNDDHKSYRAAEEALETKRQALMADWGMDPVPDEPLKRVPITFGIINVWLYGISKWGDLFNSRQKLALMTFAEKVRQAHERFPFRNNEPDFARAVATYLALALDRLADFFSMLCRWENTRENVKDVFTRQAMGMVWDFVEANPFSRASGSAHEQFESIANVLTHLSRVAEKHDLPVTVVQGSATALPWHDGTFDAVLTDPPYYDNVPYSYISDFFYVWLKRTIRDLYPDMFATPLAPKTEEIVAYLNGGGPDEAKKRFEDMLTRAFGEIRRVLKADGIAVIVFAYPKTEAWEAAINSILRSGMYMTGSWPIHTEMESRLRAQEAAALASSIYMVCRKRITTEVGEFPKVRQAIEQRVRQQLDKFWLEGIRGADFFMSAIGPAVEVFGRYERVEKLSGDKVEVKELLDYVEKVVSEFALERIIGIAELGGVDPETRFYLLWRWTYGGARVPFDEARKLANAVGSELSSLWGEGQFVRKEKEYVYALSPKEREKDKKFMNQVGFNTMVDALHRACIYWERGERTQLTDHLSQTYGANEIFWRVAQDLERLLPSGEKEKQLLQGLLGVPEARGKVPVGSGRLFDELR